MSTREEEKISADQAQPVVVYSRAICGLCWICRWHLWMGGVDCEIRSIDSDNS